MSINLKMPDIQELKPRITVFGVGGAGGNAVNNMIQAGLQGCDFVVANTDAQALATNHAERIVQMGVAVTEGLGAGSQPEVGAAAAEEVLDELNDHLAGSHMVFITAGMGGGTGTGAAPVIARAAREQGILTVGVVTKPFHFEGARRLKLADAGIEELQKNVDTLIVIPNQNLFRIANAQTTFADAFAMADQVLYSGVACITDLMVKEGLINLDFADVRSIMRGMGKAMMGTGEASGEKRAMQAAEAAIANPLLDETSMKGARGLLISITGGNDLTLFEVDEAATRIREEVDPDANIILGATFDESLDGIIRVSVVATGIDKELFAEASPTESRPSELNGRPKINEAPAPAPAALAKPAVAAQKRAAAAIERSLEIPEAAAQAASTDPAVEIKRFVPNADLYAGSDAVDALDDDLPVAPEDRHPVVEPYIPPVAERAAPTQHRMPQMEDFPPIAQREMMAKREAAPQAQPKQQPQTQQQAPAPQRHHEEVQEERRPMGLLRRLASGLGRREEHHEHDHDGYAEQVPPAQERRAPQRPPQMAPAQQRAPQMAPAPQQSERARPAQAPSRPAQPRPAQARPQQGAAGQLDLTGRQPQAPRSISDDEQLEIPAFLRRQAN